MKTWIPPSWYDTILDNIATADLQVVCMARPKNYYETCYTTNRWLGNSNTNQGILIYSPTMNDCIYECIVPGVTGATEPTFPTEEGAEFTDGEVTWKAHKNYVLAAALMSASDYTKKDIKEHENQEESYSNPILGKELIVGEKSGMLIIRDGRAAYTLLLDTVGKQILHMTAASTSLNTALEKGHLTIFYSYSIKHMADQQ